MMRAHLRLLCFALLLPVLVGCAQRTISITSDPSGALVYLNDEEVGRTPVTVPFTWYGLYDVRLVREGYAPLWTTAEARAPWWETPGPDLIAEAAGAESHIEWHFDLQQQPPVDEDQLIDRAQRLREAVEPTPVTEVQ